MSNTKEHITLWNDSELFHGIEILQASCYEHSYPAHFHDEYVIAAFSRGAQKNSVCRRTGIACAGSIMVIHPGEVHTGEAVERDQGWDYCALYPSEKLLLDIAYDSEAGNHSLNFGIQHIRQDISLADRFISVSRVLRSSPDRLEKECAVYEILVSLISRYGEMTGISFPEVHQRPEVKRGIEYLQDVYSQDIRISDIANAAGVSEYYFMRIFRAATGITAHNYLNQIRLNRAKKMLSEGICATVVAQNVGFFDQSHLNRNFKAQFGITPGKYAKCCI